MSKRQLRSLVQEQNQPDETSALRVSIAAEIQVSLLLLCYPPKIHSSETHQDLAPGLRSDGG